MTYASVLPLPVGAEQQTSRGRYPVVPAKCRQDDPPFRSAGINCAWTTTTDKQMHTLVASIIRTTHLLPDIFTTRDYSLTR